MALQSEQIRGLRYDRHGDPVEVLRLEKELLPQPRPGQVSWVLVGASINPSDLGMIRGLYGRLPELPTWAGREGVGEVIAVGEGVRNVQAGEWIPLPEGCWKEAGTAEAESLRPLPKTLPWTQLATSFINPPTAIRLLNDFVDLQTGDWIVQNAGNSALGFAVAELCRERGIHCLSLVRDPARWEKPLLEAGATAVALDDDEALRDWKRLTGGRRPRLALNSVGGESVSRMAKMLANGGVLVTFGGMTGEKMRFPTRYFIFNDIVMRGFWMDRWIREKGPEAVQALREEVLAYMKRGLFRTRIGGTYTLDQWQDALQAAAQGGRNGKILFRGPAAPAEA